MRSPRAALSRSFPSRRFSIKARRGRPNSANTVTDAKIYLKPDKAEEYAVYDLKYSGDKLVFELPYDQTGDWTGFTFYAELTDGISVAATQESAVAIERTDVDKSSLPAVLITEIMPDSSNVDGSDGYEFIELYNNSDQRINLKDYKIYYNYPDQGVQRNSSMRSSGHPL